MISEYFPNQRLRSSSKPSRQARPSMLSSNGLGRRDMEGRFCHNFVLTQCVVFEWLNRFFCVYYRCEDVVQAEVARKDIFHVMYNMIGVVVVRKTVEDMNMLHAKPNLAFGIQGRFSVQHAASYEDNPPRLVLLQRRLSRICRSGRRYPG